MNKDNKDNNITGSPHVGDLLPGYIDSSLPAGELDTVRAHLEGCDACRADYDELQAIRRMLQQMPVTLAPRSFALTEGMASRVRKPSLLERIFVPRLAPTFAGGSVVAFVLLVFLFATGNVALPVSSPQIMGSFSQQAPENSTPSDGTRLAPDTDMQPKQPNPSAMETPQVWKESTIMAQGATPNSDSVPSPATPDAISMTTSPAPPQGSLVPEDASGTTAGGPPSDVTPNTALSSSTTDKSAEPGMTTNDGNYTTTPSGTGTSILEIGLLTLGVTLAAAAVIARRRRA